MICSTAAGQGDRLGIAEFDPGSLGRWETESFRGETEYGLVTVNGHTLLRAHCDATASGLYRELEVDLTTTPVLPWAWRVAGVYQGLQEKTKAGDDFPARVYVVDSGGWFVWRTRAINYVWASGQPVGSHWLNPFAEQAMMVAVEAGAPKKAGLVHESRNVRADFRRLFGRDVDQIEAVALMTDCDNAEVEGTAWYGAIWFSAQ
ncbi:MAG: DUF3047 domain-containing protein [Salinisphaera sp.]|nr:DUF3047 domain-containing protein [Salinisphaera sp.]